MNNILIVDDDRKLRGLLQEFLTQHGFNVDSAESAEKAYSKLQSGNYDLITVDVMMPGENGIEFTRNIKKFTSIPVLMLTAKGDVEDRITGLESGADDYLPKPFEPKELYLRITKLIERSAGSAFGANNVSFEKATDNKIVHFGNFEFNLENQILMKGDERIPLSSTESELLSTLCSNINIPIDRYELAHKFHGISERSVDVQITRLRKKIEDDPKIPRYIQTSRGKGYVFRT